jgi:hypothetical protein
VREDAIQESAQSLSESLRRICGKSLTRGRCGFGREHWTAAATAGSATGLKAELSLRCSGRGRGGSVRALIFEALCVMVVSSLRYELLLVSNGIIARAMAALGHVHDHSLA